MLPKRSRLSAQEVQDVMAQGRSMRASFLSAKYISGTHALRVSAVVSKKTAKRAVDRNRLRRALYNALAGYTATGTAVIFVNKIPQEAITTAFRADLVVLLGK